MKNVVEAGIHAMYVHLCVVKPKRMDAKLKMSLCLRIMSNVN